MMARRPKILILDDEFIVGMALADELEHNGFDIAGPYTNAEESAAALDTEKPDAAFLDVNLASGRTSYALALELLQRGTPFAFLTGYSEFAPTDQRLADVRKIGKPLSPKHAVAEVKQLLSQQ